MSRKRHIRDRASARYTHTARLRRGNLHLSDSADSVSYGVHGDVAPTPFNNFNTYAGCD